MTVLSVLAGFAAAMLTTIAVNLAGPDVLSERGLDRALMLAAVALFSLSAVMLVVALLGYDRLMMPQRFWGTARSPGGPDPLRSWPVARPPSSAGWVLYQHSVRLWRWVMWALVLAGIGTLLMVGAISRICGGDTSGDAIWGRPTLPCSTLPDVSDLLANPGLLEYAEWLGYAEIVGVVLIVLGLIVFAPWLWWRLRPDLGTED
jgi:hypothetical protein